MPPDPPHGVQLGQLLAVGLADAEDRSASARVSRRGRGRDPDGLARRRPGRSRAWRDAPGPSGGSGRSRRPLGELGLQRVQPLQDVSLDWPAEHAGQQLTNGRHVAALSRVIRSGFHAVATSIASSRIRSCPM